MSVVFAKIQMRRGTAAQWAAANPILAQGELAFETDTGLTKVGDGATAYASLPSYATYDQMLAAKAALDEAALDVAAVEASRVASAASAATASTKANEAAGSAAAALASEQSIVAKVNQAEQARIDAIAYAAVAEEKADEIVASANAAAADASAADADRIAAEAARTGAEAAQATAQGAAAGALASEVAADASADVASGAAASALAIYGSVDAQNTAVAVAQAQASLAAGFAASAASVAQQDLSGVTAQALHRSPNAITALFIYDTSKDSDGGAWTERCQHTSWWNEAINGKWLGSQATEAAARAVSGATTGDYFQRTSDGRFYSLNAGSGTTEVFRGNKRDFPRLAGIVAEAANVTIYDLTEAGRPMWGRWNAGSDFFINTAGSGAITSLTAAQGLLTVGTSTRGLALFDLPKDSGASGLGAAVRKLSGDSGLSAVRNSLAFPTRLEPTNLFAIANQAVNAVAMTVLPDAPTDPVTGLRVPTIAVATGGGVSLIKDDGTVRNSVATSAMNTVALSFKMLAFTYDTSVGSSDFMYAAATTAVGAVPLTPRQINSNFNIGSENGSSGVDFNRGLATEILEAQMGDYFRRSNVSALVQRMKANHSAIRSGVAAAISNTFNTGWMTGDIRRTYLSDTEVGSVTGPELVVNGGFDTDLTGWTNSSTGTGTASVVDGSAVIASTNASNRGEITQVVSGLTVGRLYRLAFNASGKALYVEPVVFNNVTGTVSRLFTASTTSITLKFQNEGNSGTSVLDNVSVREVILDRSYKAAGASITGTLTRAQLASGTSLVGYSGFSAANYLRENWSADLDFGTSEWTESAWLNVPDTANLGGNLLRNDTIGTQTGSTRITATGPTGVSESVGQFGDGTAGFSSFYSIPFLQTPVIGRRTTVSLWVKIVSDTSGSSGSVDFYHYAGGGDQLQTFSAASRGVGNWFQISRTGLNGGTDNQFRINVPNGMVIQVTRLLLQYGSTVGTFVDGGASQVILRNPVADRAAASGASYRLFMDSLGRLGAEAADGTTTRTVLSSANYNTAQWIKARVNYTTDGTLAILVNGREVAATRGAPLLTLNNASAVLTIGNSFALDAPFPGSIALLKLGATVPTPEQATFMFEQEKQLFRAGALSVLPDSGAIVDMAYDDATDRWVAISAANESYWTGLVRNSVQAVPAGSFSRVVAGSGLELAARTGTNPGVDVTIPAYGLREELVRRAEAAARLSRELVAFDFVGGFTANTTNGSAAITNVAGLTYPGSLIGARVSGAGIPANTRIVGVSGTTIYLSAAATATATGVAVSFLDFNLPVAFEARAVLSAGALRREGSTADFTRLYDGFLETIRFAVAPGATAWVQIQATRGTMQ